MNICLLFHTNVIRLDGWTAGLLIHIGMENGQRYPERNIKEIYILSFTKNNLF